MNAEFESCVARGVTYEFEQDALKIVRLYGVRLEAYKGQEAELVAADEVFEIIEPHTVADGVVPDENNPGYNYRIFAVPTPNLDHVIETLDRLELPYDVTEPTVGQRFYGAQWGTLIVEFDDKWIVYCSK
ncbi:MAG: hypothetical protein ACLP5H_23645 [Desulfomonilaceae bacterium]